MGTEQNPTSARRFQTVLRNEIPTGRNGRHKRVVLDLLSDLERLVPGEALKISVAELPDTKANIRSALNRATKQLNIQIATSSDDEHLYVWKVG
jgi:hypothetical protein